MTAITLTADQLVDLAHGAIYENGLGAFIDIDALGTDDNGDEVAFVGEQVVTEATAAHWLAHHLATNLATWIYWDEYNWGFNDPDIGLRIDPTAPLPAIPTVTKSVQT